MLYAGLDLSRKRLDFRVLDDEGATVDAGAAPPDADGLHGLSCHLCSPSKQPSSQGIHFEFGELSDVAKISDSLRCMRYRRTRAVSAVTFERSSSGSWIQVSVSGSAVR
jgi:hypothetical protein